MPLNNYPSTLADYTSLFLSKVTETFLGMVLALSGGHLFANMMLVWTGDSFPGTEVALPIFCITFFVWYRLFHPTPTPSRPEPLETVSSFSQTKIHLRTNLQAVLIGMMIISGFLLFMTILSWRPTYTLLPPWLMRDTLIAFLSSFVGWFSLQSFFLVDPEKKTIHYHYSNLFYREIRQIPFDEIAAVAISGTLGGWPILFKNYSMEFSTLLVFKDGRVLPMYNPSKGQDFIFDWYKIHEARARKLAQTLQCSFFSGPATKNASFANWINDMRTILRDTPKPQSLEKTLWEIGMGSLSLEAMEPNIIKVDLPTLLEKLFLILIIVFFAIVTGFAVRAEWNLLLANPRFIYLILLDSSSILITILALWRWLIDEYYIFDTATQSITFHSRILFFRWQSVIGCFNDIRFLGCKTREMGKNKEHATYITLNNNEEIYLSDFTLLPGVPQYRAYAIAKLVNATKSELDYFSR